jgi:hypothetical protein
MLQSSLIPTGLHAMYNNLLLGPTTIVSYYHSIITTVFKSWVLMPACSRLRTLSVFYATWCQKLGMVDPKVSVVRYAPWIT